MSNDEELHLICPHCKESIFVLISQINCNIFRHGVYKHNLQQMDPHAPKAMCEKLVKEKLILGCGKPFSLELNKENGTYKTVICDYI